MATEYFELPLKNGKPLKINYDKFNEVREELESFLEDEDYMNNRRFAKKVLFSQEIKFNNTIEGITDDLLIIEKVISDASCIKDVKKRKRIINLYNGYKYILTHKTIDEKHLKELYGILSDGLLEKCDIVKMGDLYREDIVYILKNGRLDIEPDQGLPFDLVPKYMKIYFDYVNSNMNSDSTMTDYFIKSQVMHFYFVYIHPYFDVNGRSSRTMAMWYLLKNNIYPCIIFNRAITFEASNYDKAIIDTKKFCDLTFFIKYMMVNVKRELEKEMIMHQIKENTTRKLEAIDYQTLIYILSMNDDINVLNFATTYRRFNDFKSVHQIYDEMILPLIDKNVLEIVRTTNKYMFKDFPNEVLRINPIKYEKNNPKIKRLNLNNK